MGSLPICNLELRAAKPKDGGYPASLKKLGQHVRKRRMLYAVFSGRGFRRAGRKRKARLQAKAMVEDGEASGISPGSSACRFLA
jgi:hypothetical protein